MSKSLRNHLVKDEIGFWSLNPASKKQSLILFFLFLLLPTQFGKHFWLPESLVTGLRIDYLSPTMYVTDILIFLLFLGAIFSWRQYFLRLTPLVRKYRLQVLVSTVVSLGFLIYHFVTSDRPSIFMYGLLKLIEYGFLFLYVTQVIHSRRQLTQLSFIIAFSAMTQSIIAIFQYLKQGSLNGWLYFLGERMFTGGTSGIANVSLNGDLILRPYGTLPHPNVLAGFLLITIVLAWFFLLPVRQRLFQIIGSVTILLGSITLLLTFSRMGIILWGFLVMLVIIRKIRQKKESARRLPLLFFCAVLGILLFCFSLTQDVVTRFVETSIMEESFVERISLIESALTMIRQHPFVGVGFLHFIPSLAPLQQPFSLGVFLQPVHNVYLLVAAEAGLLGFTAFLGFLYLTYQRIHHQISSLRLPFFLLLSLVLIIGLFDHYWLTLQQGQLLFVMILGFIWARYSHK